MADTTEPLIDEQNHSFRLVFTEGVCDLCGDRVPVALPCRCGDHPGHPDLHVMESREMLAGLVARTAGAANPGTPIELSAALGALSGWIEEMFEGLSAAGDAPCDPAPLEATLERLVEVRDAIAGTSRQRPMLALWNPLAEVVDRLIGLACCELDVLLAETPDDARSLQPAARRSSMPLRSRSG